jgi:hypothetical protein
MNVELVAQMFKNYQSNVLFHLEGLLIPVRLLLSRLLTILQLPTICGNLYERLLVSGNRLSPDNEILFGESRTRAQMSTRES